MKIEQHISLSAYTTLRLGGEISCFGCVSNESDIVECAEFAKSKNIPIFPLGGGSNIIVSDTLSPLFVLKMENKGIQIIKEDKKGVIIRVLAGVVWDDFVDFTVKEKYSGIEALSAIPGTCGATPVQNVGAYGQEVSNVIESVRIYNLETNKFEDIAGQNCGFLYRDSIFKKELKGKCVIESVVFKLLKSDPTIPNYPKVAEVLEEIQKSKNPASLNDAIRQTIQTIRSEKLPDPKQLPNVGSFFKNAYLGKSQHEKIVKKFPNIPNFVSEDSYKIPAGWLIEQVGFKGASENGVGVYAKNALVLINQSATSTIPLLALAHKIQKSVYERFGISIEIEPEILS